MITVALIGPDGAGKTTVGRRLEQTLPVPCRYIYMGVNLEASHCLLPTSRLIRTLRRRRGVRDEGGPRDPDRTAPPPRDLIRRTMRSLKRAVSVTHRMADEWYRQLVAQRLRRRGCVVVFDRHYFSDYYAYDIETTGRPRPLSSRLHGWMLRRVYPRPDLVICLDAPGDVLHARKGEGTPELLERRRQDYLALAPLVERFVIVDAARSADEVARDVAEHVLDFYQHRLPSRGGMKVR
ncbi:MAG: dTMP kinase [Planctomycetaceae bacterium]